MNLLQQLDRVSLRDGIGDLVVGSSNFSPGGLTYAGAVLIYFGSTNWPATLDMADADVTLAGDVAGGYLAYSLCAADFDGDGIDDLAVTAPARSPSPGSLGRGNQLRSLRQSVFIPRHQSLVGYARARHRPDPDPRGA